MAKKPKTRTISLGSRGKITIKHPGAFRAKAKKAGMSTRAYAQKEKGASGILGRQARLAITLLGMGKKKRRRKRKSR